MKRFGGVAAFGSRSPTSRDARRRNGPPDRVAFELPVRWDGDLRVTGSADGTREDGSVQEASGGLFGARCKDPASRHLAPPPISALAGSMTCHDAPSGRGRMPPQRNRPGASAASSADSAPGPPSGRTRVRALGEVLVAASAIRCQLYFAPIGHVPPQVLIKPPSRTRTRSFTRRLVAPYPVAGENI